MKRIETAFILIQLFHNLGQNLTLTYLSEIPAVFFGNGQGWKLCNVGFHADSDPTTALHNDLSHPKCI